MKKPQPESVSAFDDFVGDAETRAPERVDDRSLHIRATVAHLSAAQKKFNLLLGQIAAARAELAVWLTESRRLQERHLLEIVALAKPVQAQQLELVQAVDALLLSPPPGLKMTVRRKHALSGYLLLLVNTLLQSDPENSELQALHDRHSEDDLASVREQQREINLDIAQDMLSDLYGPEMVDREGVLDFEDLIQRTRERVADKQRVEQPPRKRNKREQAGDARKKADSDALTQSLREIYRKLVSTLHPDRELDSALRAQKTALMQRINIAYQNNDLLTLLSLQMEVEQITSAGLAEVPEARILQYNQILRDQLDTLKAQKIDIIGALVDAFETEPTHRAPSVADLDRALNQNKKHLQGVQHFLKLLTDQLKDPSRRNTGVDQVVSMIAEQEKLDRYHEREDAKMARFFRF
jgi:hypothetical protein